MQFSAISSSFASKKKGRYEEDEDQNLFQSLPLEIVTDILSRLPSCRSTIKCKLVCKAWRNAIESREFANYRLHSKPEPHLVLFSNLSRQHESETYKRMIELPMPENGEGGNGSSNNVAVVKLGLNDYSLQPVQRTSVGGLILLSDQGNDLRVCNPVTSEYVKIPDPPEQSRSSNYFGFGLCRTSNQYKVVNISGKDCQVYTLGTTTRQWRSARGGVGPDLTFSYKPETKNTAFAGGNLYWLDSETETRVSCFDLEVETFSYFTAPPPPHPRSKRSMCALNDCLCLCDVSPRYMYEEGGVGVEVWMMNKDHVWSREFVIKVRLHTLYYLFPIKVFEDGSIVFGESERERAKMFYYPKDGTEIKLLYPIDYRGRDGGVGDFSEQRAFETVCFIAGMYFATTAVFTPSFLSLKTLLAEEDVQMFQTS